MRITDTHEMKILAIKVAAECSQLQADLFRKLSAMKAAEASNLLRAAHSGERRVRPTRKQARMMATHVKASA